LAELFLDHGAEIDARDKTTATGRLQSPSLLAYPAASFPGFFRPFGGFKEEGQRYDEY
jgi:hypothetical protein